MSDDIWRWLTRLCDTCGLHPGICGHSAKPAEVFTQSRADRDAELAAHDQLSREAVELRAEVERLRKLANLWFDRAEAAEARLRKVEALADDLGERGIEGPNDSSTDREHRYGIREAARRLRAALAANPAEVTPPAEQRAEGGA